MESHQQHAKGRSPVAPMAMRTLREGQPSKAPLLASCVRRARQPPSAFICRLWGGARLKGPSTTPILLM
eukprot:scaffold1181_cov387-Prasinococcus_capsulatus_cf.AAC.9